MANSANPQLATLACCIEMLVLFPAVPLPIQIPANNTEKPVEETALNLVPWGKNIFSIWWLRHIYRSDFINIKVN